MTINPQRQRGDGLKPGGGGGGRRVLIPNGPRGSLGDNENARRLNVEITVQLCECAQNY